MDEREARPALSQPGPLILLAAWAGLLSGLIEGPTWMVIQRFDRLTNLWTQVIWIAPILNALVFLVLGVVLALGVRLVPVRWRGAVPPYLVAMAFAVVFVAQVFNRYVHVAVLPILVLGIASALTRLLRRDEAASLRLIRRTLPVMVAATVALLVGTQGYYALRERTETRNLRPADPGAPDVVVVVIDALRSDHVSAYGYPRPTSPFLDRLARDGVLFERAVSPSPYSLPSHASLLSGLYPDEHEVEWLQFNVFRDADYPSIAEALRDRGYRTGAFSSNPFWFTREQGFGRGFIRFEDFYHSAADMAYRTVLGKIMERIQPRFGFEQIPARKEASESVDRVLDWVDREERPPFFAVINLFDVHDPYTPPQPFRSMFSDAEAPGGILNWRLGRGELELTPEERLSEIEAYDGALAYVDAELERLYQALRSRRPERELLLIVTSDHGEAFNEHGGYLHARSLYREELLIPLIMAGPGVASGARIDRPVSSAAIPATILDLVSGGAAPTFGAASLAPLWRDSTSHPDWEYPLAEVAQRDWAGPVFRVYYGGIRSLFSPDWHYIANDSLPEELYSWADTLERDSRAADTALTAVLEDFRRRLAVRPRPVYRKSPGREP